MTIKVSDLVEYIADQVSKGNITLDTEVKDLNRHDVAALVSTDSKLLIFPSAPFPTGKEHR